jgi:hypothetical protein
MKNAETVMLPNSHRRSLRNLVSGKLSQRRPFGLAVKPDADDVP